MGYQLFPNVNLVGLFKDSPAFITQDPIDVELHRRVAEKKQIIMKYIIALHLLVKL